MIQICKRKITHTKDNIIHNRFLALKIGCMLIVALLFVGIPADTVQAASGLKIYEYATKKESTYTGKQITVTYNGATVGKTKTPGILVAGVAMVPYNDIFEKSGIEADCFYNKDKGTVTIEKFGKTIFMKIGSKSATVNGKTVTLPVAPIKIKYVNAGIAKVLVPSRFVAETMGLGYTWNSNYNRVAIEKHSMQLSFNDGNKFEYVGAQGLVSINGKKVDLSNMPSIITNNTAMLRAKRVFSDSEIAAQYRYNKADKTVTLSKNGNVLKMTIGSKTAYLNDKPIKLDTAPMILKNYDTNKSYVMVPGSFTASCLGYDYKWNNSSKTSMISTQKKETTSSGSNSSGMEPELGGSDTINEAGSMLNQWIGNNALYSTSSELKVQNTGITTSEPGYIYQVTRDYSNVKQNSETFMISATAPIGKVTASNSGKVITLIASNSTCADQSYQMLGVSSNFVNSSSTYNNPNSKSITINFEVLPDNYQYDIAMSADNKTIYLTVYLNTLTSAVLGTNSNGDYLTLEGLSALKVSMNKSSNLFYIDLPYTTNSLGDIYTSVIGAKYINLIYTINYTDKTQIILSMNEGFNYYIAERGNQSTIYFGTTGESPQQPTTGIEETSNFEIVIPKPQGIVDSMISHEDYYFNKRFAIKLPGDYTQFFQSNLISHNSNVINNVTVSLNSNYETEIMFYTSRLQGYELRFDADNIYVNIGEPKDIYKNIVVLDPGHGGAANGANYFGTMEKDINYKILYTIGKKYFNQNTSKLKVYFTRITDVDMTLSNRAAFAECYDADLFVSLHMNASTSSSACGTEVYYSNKNNSANSAGLTSKGMASIFVHNIANNLGTANRGVKQEIYTVVHKNSVPAVLIELGFMSNKNDFAKITDETFQDNSAKTIYETLLQVFEEYPTGR